MVSGEGPLAITFCDCGRIMGVRAMNHKTQRHLKRKFAVAAVAIFALTVFLGSCSSSDNKSSSTTSSVVGNVLPPVVLSPTNTSATVKVGTVVTFNMGEPQGGGKFVAVSETPSVFKVTSEGRVEGGVTYNAGGEAVAKGKTTVSVSFRGSMNGMGTPTNFTITVE